MQRKPDSRLGFVLAEAAIVLFADRRPQCGDLYHLVVSAGSVRHLCPGLEDCEVGRARYPDSPYGTEETMSSGRVIRYSEANVYMDESSAIRTCGVKRHRYWGSNWTHWGPLGVQNGAFFMRIRVG